MKDYIVMDGEGGLLYDENDEECKVLIYPNYSMAEKAAQKSAATNPGKSAKVYTLVSESIAPIGQVVTTNNKD